LKAAYTRLLLKLSGEGLAGESGSGISPAVIGEVAGQVREVHALGVQVSIVIFGGGTGNPYFTTDSAAALRAAEIHADVVLKATQVDGVYSADPDKNPNAERFDTLTYDRAIRDDLRFMDQAAIALCRENKIPIVVFDMSVPGNIMKVVTGESVGTVVS